MLTLKQITKNYTTGDETVAALKGIDISQMTPMSAMNKLYELQEMLKK